MRIVKDYLGKVSITCEGEWDKTKAYDRLCMVNTMKLVMFYGGNPISIPFSYISKKSVPKGIDINNTSYWMPVGAQIEGAIKEIDKGVPNGVVPLNENGIIPDRYLPSYVQDVVEFETFEDLPIPGESNKIYIVTSTNAQYRWNATSESYHKLSKLLELGTTPGTAFDGAQGFQLRVETDHLNLLEQELIQSTRYNTGNILEFKLNCPEVTDDDLTHYKFTYIHDPYDDSDMPSTTISANNVDGHPGFMHFCQSLEDAIDEDSETKINVICHLLIHQDSIFNSYIYDKVLLTCKRSVSNNKTTFYFEGFVSSVSAMNSSPALLYFYIEKYKENGIDHAKILQIGYNSERLDVPPATSQYVGGFKLGFQQNALNRAVQLQENKAYITLQYVTNTIDGILKKEDYKKLLYLHNINNNVLNGIANNISDNKYDSLFHIKLHIVNLSQLIGSLECWTKDISEDYSYLDTLLETDDELNVLGITITDVEDKIFVDFTNINIIRENNIITLKYISNKYNAYRKKNIEIVYIYDVSNDGQSVFLNESNLIDIPSDNSIGGIIAPQVTGNFNNKGYTNIPFAVASPSGRLIGKLATVDNPGFMSAADKTKLNNIDDNANNYSLPTSTDTTLGGVRTHPLTIDADPKYHLADFDNEAIGNYIGTAAIRKSSYKKAGVIKSNTIIEIADINSPTDKEKGDLLNHFKTYGNFSNVTIKCIIPGDGRAQYFSGIFHNILLDEPESGNTNLNIYVPYRRDDTPNVSAFKINFEVKIADIEDVLK